MPCSLPRWSGSAHYGYLVGALPRRAFPDPLGLPQSSAGSAPTWWLSRPARASHALPPARLLIHHSWTLSRGSRQPRSQDCCSPAIESNHQLFEWVLPPLVICPFGARRRISMRHATVTLLKKSSPIDRPKKQARLAALHAIGSIRLTILYPPQ